MLRLPVEELDYKLPDHLVAATPAARRDEARLMVFDRATGRCEHLAVSDAPSFAHEGDAWVFNDTKVIPARMVASDGKTEVLLLEETSPLHWKCLSFPGKKTMRGTRLQFLATSGDMHPLDAEILETLETGERVVRFYRKFDLGMFGQLPIPPYIVKRRLASGEPAYLPEDTERYQTVYGKSEGSVAAPTAGLHFTEEIMGKLPCAFVTLHVGVGTFRPIKTRFVDEHVMHGERFCLSPENAQKIAVAKRRVVVGTTTVRALESMSDLRARSGLTHLMITPPHAFRHTSALLTNFHLPRSTLMLMVAAFLSDASKYPEKDGLPLLKQLYAEAIRKEYRFFSYGDAMLIL